MGVGLTASAGALGVWALAVEAAYLHPFWRVVAADYGWYVAGYGGTALVAFGTGAYLAARVIGLGAVGRKVDVVERAIRRGDGSKQALAGIIFGLGMALGAANFIAWMF